MGRLTVLWMGLTVTAVMAWSMVFTNMTTGQVIWLIVGAIVIGLLPIGLLRHPFRRVREYIRREVDAGTRIYRWFIVPTGVIIMLTLFVVFLVLWEKYEDHSKSLPTHDEWYVVGMNFREMYSIGLYDYWTIKIERQPSEPKDAPRDGAYIVPVFDKEPCIEDVLARGVGHRLPDSCEQYPKDLIDGVLNK